jgi:ADP-dependent NAD(P)H-hydrate dehydratase / NAD(P)H-hydrate epimerase
VRGAWPVEQIRAAERQLMAGLPAGTLMARAARAVSVTALELLGFGYGARVLLLVGGGDNGADALYAGAELARRGVAVQAVLAAASTSEPALAAFRAAGGRVVELAAASEADLIIDGLVGIGARGPLRTELLPLVAHAEDRRVLAVDLPSGVDPETGAVSGPAIRAEVTVCMGGYKPGLLVGAGRLHAGEVRLADIGIAEVLPEPSLRQLEDADVDIRRPGPADDKYTRGVVGVAAGSASYPGAALLCTGSARLGGVGAVRYAGHAAAEVVRVHPEVLVTDTVAAAGRVQAWVVGPGLGSAEDAVESLRAVLAADVPVIIDADGLNLLAERRELLDRRTAPTVLTPHDREYQRLFGEVGEDRIGAARRAAAEAGATVLLKGYATVMAQPDGLCYLNPTGHPALATAGSGDVLAGLVGSLLATGVEPGLAAATAAYLHGRAAAGAARRGPVVAGDLVTALAAELAD